MTERGSVSEWLSSLQRGSPEAADKLWKRYYESLVRMAHHKLWNLPQRAADKEDVAQEAFASFFQAVEAGRFPRLHDRDDLWQILLKLTDWRAKDRMRTELAVKRGGGDVRGDSAFMGAGQSSDAGGIDRLVSRDPTPETVDDVIELLRSRSETFQDEKLCAIAVDKFAGYENREIAQRQGIALRAVERKLQLIRRLQYLGNIRRTVSLRSGTVNPVVRSRPGAIGLK